MLLVSGMPSDLATSTLSRMAKATPSSTACVMSARLVSILMPMNVPRALVSLMGLRSPMRYGRKYTWFVPSFSSVMGACSPA